jgi:hypothetical protein
MLNVCCFFPTKLIRKYLSYLLFYVVEIVFHLCSYLFSQQNLVVHEVALTICNALNIFAIENNYINLFLDI